MRRRSGTDGSIAALWHPDYEQQAWHFYLVFVLCLTISLFINIFGSRSLHLFDAAGVFLLTGGGVLLIVVTLAVAGAKSTSPKFQSADFVFTTFINVRLLSSASQILTTGL